MPSWLTWLLVAVERACAEVRPGGRLGDLDAMWLRAFAWRW